MPPTVLIEKVKHQVFLRAFREFLKGEAAGRNLRFLKDKSSHEALYHQYIRPDAPDLLDLPENVRAPLAVLADQKRWNAMGPGLKEARKVVAAHTNNGVLQRFMDSPGG
jgi:hypothetical protein